MKSKNDLFSGSLELATIIHQKHIRKGSDIPYIVHPVEVAFILQENNADIDMICAGLLHDTLEDGDLSLEIIKKKILDKTNDKVLEYVIGASEKLENRDNTPWEERKQHTLDYLRNENTSKQIKMISCADKLSNARSMYRDIKVKKEKLWEIFNAGYEEQKWYYEGLVDSLSSLKDYEMYKEFQEVVKKIFTY